MDKIKYIIRQVAGDCADFSFYFDEDGLTSAGGDYCCNLFIVTFERHACGFNMDEYKNIQDEIENLLEMYTDIVNDSDYKQYSSVGQMLYDQGLLSNIKNTRRIKAFKEFFDNCNEKPNAPYSNYYTRFDAFNSEMTAEYLTLKTGKNWSVESAKGYCQVDYVEIVYCPEFYTDGVKQYGEVWLGAATEFYTIKIDENGEEADTIGGYIVADCQAWTDEDYKRVVCELACIPENETQLELIDGSRTYTKYSYRII